MRHRGFDKSRSHGRTGGGERRFEAVSARNLQGQPVAQLPTEEAVAAVAVAAVAAADAAAAAAAAAVAADVAAAAAVAVNAGEAVDEMLHV